MQTGELDDDQRFTLFVRDSGTPRAQAKVVLGYDDKAKDTDGFEFAASGTTDELIVSLDHLDDALENCHD